MSPILGTRMLLLIEHLPIETIFKCEQQINLSHIRRWRCGVCSLHFLWMATAMRPISTETFFSDHSVFKFMFHSCLAAKMSTLAGFCSLTEYLYICRRLYNEAAEKCTYPA